MEPPWLPCSVLMKWLELKLLILDHSPEIHIGAIALIFTLLGRLAGQKIFLTAEKRTGACSLWRRRWLPDSPSTSLLSIHLGISKRELEVLQGMSEGLSNQELADRLFVSLNTIKTHNSRLFEKLDVKRRTQAVEKAKTPSTDTLISSLFGIKSLSVLKITRKYERWKNGLFQIRVSFPTIKFDFRMKKIVLSFGLIAGAIITAMMVVATSMLYTNPDFKGNDLIGYTTMLIAFAFIFCRREKLP